MIKLEELTAEQLTVKTVEKLKREQRRRAKKIIRTDDPPYTGSIVTGVDVTYRSERAYAVAVTYDYNNSEIIAIKKGIYPVRLPYLTGLFQIREGPIVVDLLHDMENTGPVLIDANGILHPRRFGLASYVGLELNKQTIGVAKRLLFGEIGEREGDIAPVRIDDEILGAAVWLGEFQKPIFVSIGHRVSLETAIEIVKACARNGKPFPLHQAHLLSRERF